MLRLSDIPSKPQGSPALSADALADCFHDCMDFERREILPGGTAGSGVSVCWIDGLVSGKNFSGDVLRPLTDAVRLGGCDDARERILRILSGAVWACSASCRSTTGETAADLLRGCCAVVFDTVGSAVTFEVKSEAGRSVSQPTIEKTVKGAKDAFVEVLRTNTCLVRRRLRTTDLKLVQTVVGRRSGTDVAVLYIEGIANPDIISELRRRLDAIDVDGLTAAGHLEQYLADRPGSPFPQFLHTERPDAFAAELLAGRVGLLADGIPVGFLLPVTLPGFLHVAEDRAQHWMAASALTLLRWFSLLVSLTFPAFFTAIAMYHQEMIPTALLQSIVEAKRQVPFSEAFEILSMLVAFELLMEAGIRLPDPVGDTVSIIGALIVGQSAVEAKVLSPISVIIVAVTAICGFTLPSRDLCAALRLLRLALVIAAVFLGLFGLALGLALLLWYLCTLECFGTSYTAPLSEGGFQEVLKALLRFPLPKDKLRERALHTTDRRNQA